jgi:hypothetical protein
MSEGRSPNKRSFLLKSRTERSRIAGRPPLSDEDPTAHSASVDGSGTAAGEASPSKRIVKPAL